MQQEEEEEEEVGAWQHQWVRTLSLNCARAATDGHPSNAAIYFKMSILSTLYRFTRRMHCYVTMPLPSFLLLSESE